jgi:hypothetical protein
MTRLCECFACCRRLPTSFFSRSYRLGLGLIETETRNYDSLACDCFVLNTGFTAFFFPYYRLGGFCSLGGSFCIASSFILLLRRPSICSWFFLVSSVIASFSIIPSTQTQNNRLFFWLRRLSGRRRLVKC